MRLGSRRHAALVALASAACVCLFLQPLRLLSISTPAALAGAPLLAQLCPALNTTAPPSSAARRAVRGASAPPGRRFLLVVPSDCGTTGKHRHVGDAWVNDGARAYDTILLDHSAGGDCAGGQPVDGVLAVPRAFKLAAVHALFTQVCPPALLDAYDVVGLCDDDLEFQRGAAGVLDAFLYTVAGGFALAQPALARGSALGHKVLVTRGGPPRRTRFLEVMCPLLPTATLRAVLPSFAAQTSGWGVDLAWSVAYAGRLGVLDPVEATHAKPVSAANKVYRRLGGLRAAWADWERARRRAGLSEAQTKEMTARDPGEPVAVSIQALRAEPWLADVADG